jgi:ribosomal protein S12 methylthiotransferase
MKRCVDIITMGCSKNLVDSEKILYQLQRNGYLIYHNPKRIHHDIVVVNTCGFISDAQEESINMILSMADMKSKGKIRKLFVMGCLSERFLSVLCKEIPEVDHYYGKFNWTALVKDLDKKYFLKESNRRILTTPSHYAYLKISEGCNRGCAYCAIPISTGRHKSRPMDEILDEVRLLVSQGVKEFQVIAQELTYYGVDLYGKRRIAELVEKIADIPGVEWIRLHYAYPLNFPMDLLRVMREKDNVCKYLDIAFQHVSDRMLKAMHRHVSHKETKELIERMRKEVPGIHIRTTLMCGFPGETEEDFCEMKEFVRWARFERMGAFAYSHEVGTYSGTHYEDDVPQEVKERRVEEIMAIQQQISGEVQEAKVGKTFKVIIDRREGDYYVGRTEFDSPEVDPEVLIPVNEGRLYKGHFYKIQIKSADDFDLYGSRIK